MLQPNDYDVEVTEIQIAHRITLEAGTDLDIWCNGRETYGLTMPLEGSLKFVFSNGQTVVVKPGDVALIADKVAYHAYVNDPQGCDHYTVNFQVADEALKNWMRGEPICVIQPQNMNLYHPGLEAMVSKWSKRKPGFRMQARGQLLLVLANFLWDLGDDKLDVAMYYRTLPAKQMIEVRFHENLSLQQLAQECHLDVERFRHAFKAVYKQPPMSYLNQYRIEKAKEFLMVGLSITDTAMRCGYQDISYFIRVFRKIAGVTPRQYQKSL